MHSRSYKGAFFVCMTFLMSWRHGLNLSTGKDIDKERVLTLHPSSIADSESMPSSASFDRERQSSRGIGSLGEMGLQIVWIARPIALDPLILLSPRSGITVMPSSI